jgi:hypothetical protein
MRSADSCSLLLLSGVQRLSSNLPVVQHVSLRVERGTIKALVV